MNSIEKVVKFEYNDEVKSVSIAKQKIWVNNGEIVVREPLHRQAFMPGQIEDVKAFTALDDSNPQINFLNTVWTEEVIAEYQAFKEQQRLENNS